MRGPARLATAILAIGPAALAIGLGACSSSDGRADVVAQPTALEDALNVGIVVPDGAVLNGRLFGDEHDSLVILSHMLPNDQTAWTPFARTLAEHGYAALTFDFRGFGASGGDRDFGKLDEDLAAALSFMRARGKSSIFLVGASMGATTSLVVAAQDDVAGVVSISAPAEFEDQHALDAIPAVSEPILLIAAEEDTAAVVSLEELREAAGSNATSQAYTGGEHGTALFDGFHAADVEERILQFLALHSGTD